MGIKIVKLVELNRSNVTFTFILFAVSCMVKKSGQKKIKMIVKRQKLFRKVHLKD